MIFVSGFNGSVFPSVHLSSQPSSVAIYLNKSKKLLYEISHLNNNTWLWLTLHHFQRIQLVTSWSIIAQSGLMEVFLQNIICLKTMPQIRLKSGRLGLVCMVSRVENKFTMSLTNSKLHIYGCSRLQNILKACCKSITVASIQKANQLNSKINFVEKGKQPCS